MQVERAIQISQNVADIYRMFDYLPYRTYKYNRLLRPDISAEQWKLIFPPEQVDRFELRLQGEGSKHFREQLHKAIVALYKAGHAKHAEAITFLSDLYVEVRLAFDAPPAPVTDKRMRELEASYLDARSA